MASDKEPQHLRSIGSERQEMTSSIRIISDGLSIRSILQLFKLFSGIVSFLIPESEKEL
ncbi:MAG: hypothetical protein ACM3MI_05640 [Clostridiales bacterium]